MAIRYPHGTLSLRVLLAVLCADAAVINRLHGSAQSEVGFASSGGGTHIYLVGQNLGSAFAPPAIYLGQKLQAECKPQPFTSSKNRIAQLRLVRGTARRGQAAGGAPLALGEWAACSQGRGG